MTTTNQTNEAARLGRISCREQSIHSLLLQALNVREANYNEHNQQGAITIEDEAVYGKDNTKEEGFRITIKKTEPTSTLVLDFDFNKGGMMKVSSRQIKNFEVKPDFQDETPKYYLDDKPYSAETLADHLLEKVLSHDGKTPD